MKTNVMRLLEEAKIPFEAREFPVDLQDLSAGHAASLLQLPAERLFKTLVLRGGRGGVFVCCIPATGTIDLRKAAKASGEKKAEMLPMKDLPATTGYQRGGCSPIGMKRRFALYIDAACEGMDTIAVSAGARGAMVLLSPQALIAYTGARTADLTLP